MTTKEKYYKRIDALITKRRGIVIEGLPGSACLEVALGYIAARHGLESGTGADDKGNCRGGGYECGFGATMRRINKYDAGKFLDYYAFKARYPGEYHDAFEAAKDYPFIMYFCKDTWYHYITLLFDWAALMPEKKAYLVYYENSTSSGGQMSWSKKDGIKFCGQGSNHFEKKTYIVPPNVYLINISIEPGLNEYDDKMTDTQNGIFPVLKVKRDPSAIADDAVRRLYFLIDDFITAEKEFGYDGNGRPINDGRFRDFYRLGEAYFFAYQNIEEAVEGVIDVFYERLRKTMAFGRSMVSIQDRLMTKLIGIISAELGITIKY